MNFKILLVGWGYPPNIDGGLDIHVKELFDGLSERGADVTLVLPEERAPENDSIIGVNTGEGNMIQRARNMSSKVAEISQEFDVIHTHDWFGTEAGFKSKKYSDCVWISTIHSIGESRNRDGVNKDIRKLERVSVVESDVSITVSKKLASEIKNEFDEHPKIIYNGFSKAKTSDLDVKQVYNIEDKLILFLGRHAKQKGIEHLIYGFKKYLESNEAVLMIGGDGWMRESLENFVEILGISSRVIFTGHIDEEELGDYYKAADLFVSPSINEPFGLTISEALSVGTPVAATESGINEIISDDAIIEIEPNSESIQKGLREGLTGKREVKIEERSWEDMVQEILDLYKSEIND